VVRACCAKGIKRLVYVSSTDVFMRGGKVIDETCRIDPDRLDSVYAKSKAMATLEVLRSARDGLDAVVVFPSAVLGPNDINRSMTGRAVMQYARGKGAKWYFDGVYDFVDVRDAADGIIRAWQMGGRGESYILSGSACTIKQLLEAVQTCTGRAMIKRRIPTPVFRFAAALMPFLCAVTGRKPFLSICAAEVLLAKTSISSAKACAALSFAPRPFLQTVEDTIAWYDSAAPR